MNLFPDQSSRIFNPFFEYKIHCQQWYLFHRGIAKHVLNYREVLDLFKKGKLPTDRLYIVTNTANMAQFIMRNCFGLSNDQWRYLYTANDVRGLDGITIFWYLAYVDHDLRIRFLDKALNDRNCVIINLKESDYLTYKDKQQ